MITIQLGFNYEDIPTIYIAFLWSLDFIDPTYFNGLKKHRIHLSVSVNIRHCYVLASLFTCFYMHVQM